MVQKGAPGALLAGALLRRAATALSLAFMPMFTGAYVLLALCGASTDSAAAAAGWFLLSAGLSAGVPTADLLRRLQSRSISDIQVAVRGQRMRPLLVSLVCTAAALALVALMGGPIPVRAGLAAALVTGATLTVVTRWWQISFHAGTAAGGVVLMVWQFGPAAVVLLPLLAAICWARIYLRRHTPAQIATGLAAGAALTLATIGYHVYP